VTASAAYPPVWLPCSPHEAEQSQIQHAESWSWGGSPAPGDDRCFRDGFGVQCKHAWGMTEMSRSAASARSRPSTKPCLGKKSTRWNASRADDLRRGNENRRRRRQGIAARRKASAICWCAGPGYSRNTSRARAAAAARRLVSHGRCRTIDPEGYMQITDARRT